MSSQKEVLLCHLNCLVSILSILAKHLLSTPIFDTSSFQPSTSLADTHVLTKDLKISSQCPLSAVLFHISYFFISSIVSSSEELFTICLAKQYLIFPFPYLFVFPRCFWYRNTFILSARCRKHNGHNCSIMFQLK